MNVKSSSDIDRSEYTDMTRIYVKKTFECLYDRDSGRIFEDMEFRNCRFESCGLSITRDPKLRSVARNIRFIDCEQQGCVLDSAIVEDVLVDGLSTNGLFQAFGAVYKHVVFRGRIGRIMLSPLILPGSATPDQQSAFQAANGDYYKNVDWVLDISEAQAEEIDIRGIPAQLIRRDSDTQAVITREKAMRGHWRDDFGDTYWGRWIDLFLKGGERDAVMVAPKRHRKYRQLRDGLRSLRDAGVVEPN